MERSKAQADGGRCFQEFARWIFQIFPLKSDWNMFKPADFSVGTCVYSGDVGICWDGPWSDPNLRRRFRPCGLWTLNAASWPYRWSHPGKCQWRIVFFACVYYVTYMFFLIQVLGNLWKSEIASEYITNKWLKTEIQIVEFGIEHLPNLRCLWAWCSFGTGIEYNGIFPQRGTFPAKPLSFIILHL